MIKKVLPTARRLKLILTGLSLAFLLNGCIPSAGGIYMKERWKITGRGEAWFEPLSIYLKDCLISDMGPSHKNLEFEFEARATQSAGEVQIWSGFSFRDRDTRYALGLRGAKSNDLYLCRYSPGGKNTMLALVPLEEMLRVDTWYRFRIVLWDSTIAVFMNDEDEARILLTDPDPIGEGAVVLGGGWKMTEYRNIKIRPLDQEAIARCQSECVARNSFPTFRPDEMKRAKNRKTYKPQDISFKPEGRTIISLDGDWLFKPEYEFTGRMKGIDINESDEDWHVLPVPGFWNPVTNWMHLQNAGLPHPGSGVSDQYWKKERRRCAEYTFDSEKTGTGWYRHWILLPEDIQSKQLLLQFDAVSRAADIWVNGTYAGSHIGMFGDFSLNITDAVKPGQNLIAIRVRANPGEVPDEAERVEDIAVTVEVTREMLHSLPHGMFGTAEGGIWQPVHLLITDPVRIDDVFIRTSMHGARVHMDIINNGKKQQNCEYQVRITNHDKNGVLFASERIPVKIIAGTSTRFEFSTPDVKADLWSPDHPNIYQMDILLFRDGMLVDNISESIGFRTFEIQGNRFYLNGKPYWLRGANHPPLGIAPNDSNLAHTFMKLMHDNNQMITRTHGAPLSEAWVQAADVQGVGLSVEGTWPWLMLGDEMPSADLLEVWKKEMLSLVKKYRNHPSVLIWTMGNEMYFTNYYHNDSKAVRIQKWNILSDAIRAVRELDPTRPVCATSGYIRYQPDYENVLKPAGIDDGDIDDSHNSYFGWYNPDQFYLYDGGWTKKLYLSTGANKDRPFITQELSSGYPNNDTGHPTRKYIFKHYVPQAWVGDWAYEDHDPGFFLQRHAFLTKEIAEVLRRTSPDGAGILHFANTCWFRNIDDYRHIEPYPVVMAMKKAFQPVLVSAELYGRSYYAGDLLSARICIINDLESGEALSQGKLQWQIANEDSVMAEGSIPTGRISHYGRFWIPLEIKLPEALPAERIHAKLNLSLVMDDKTYSENDYDLTLTNQKWLNVDMIPAGSQISLYDPVGDISKALEFTGILSVPLQVSYENHDLPDGLVIVSGLDKAKKTPDFWKALRKKIEEGGRVLLIHPGNHILSLFPEWADSCLEEPGNLVHMHIPESSVFKDLDPLDLSWWQSQNRDAPVVCRRSFRFTNTKGVDKLAIYIRPHAYLGNPEQLKEMSGTPLVMVRVGKGKLMLCEMEVEKAPIDPVAAKLLVNMIRALAY